MEGTEDRDAREEREEREERERLEEELIREGILSRLHSRAAADRPGRYGRRATDAITFTPKTIGMLGGIVAIVLALFSPVFYVRDMASTLRNVAALVEEVSDAQRVDRVDIAELKALYVELRTIADENSKARIDHELRIRELERNTP